ncbi:hypothetical protein [Metabacillus sp. RGM 3146]|uniref:hypothetical protein n=1 Tax=Metabacillus sp. RGM 3146 TaxID=3401092 RepID=UPI003B9D524A
MKGIEKAMYILILIFTAANAAINFSLKGGRTVGTLSVIAFSVVLIMFILTVIYRRKKK